VIEYHAIRVNAPMSLEIVQHHACTLSLIIQVRGMDPDELIVRQRHLHLFFENGHLIPGVQVESDFADAQHGGFLQKFGDEGNDFAGEDHIFRLFGVDADPAVVINQVLRGPGGLVFRDVIKVIVEGCRRLPVVSRPECRFAAGHRSHTRHAFVILRGACDHVDVGFNHLHDSSSTESASKMRSTRPFSSETRMRQAS